MVRTLNRFYIERSMSETRYEHTLPDSHCLGTGALAIAPLTIPDVFAKGLKKIRISEYITT